MHGIQCDAIQMAFDCYWMVNWMPKINTNQHLSLRARVCWSSIVDRCNRTHGMRNSIIITFENKTHGCVFLFVFVLFGVRCFGTVARLRIQQKNIGGCVFFTLATRRCVSIHSLFGFNTFLCIALPILLVQSSSVGLRRFRRCGRC